MSSPAPHPSEPPSLAQLLSLLLRMLRETAAARASKDRSTAPMVLLLWPYLHRVASRFTALTARMKAGMPAGRPASGSVRKPGDRARALPRLRLPQGFGWLVRRVPDAIHYRSQLQHLLGDPQMRDLLAASPQAGRVPRPLCRMLGIGPDPDIPPALFPPKIPRRSSTPVQDAPEATWGPENPTVAIGGRLASA